MCLSIMQLVVDFFEMVARTFRPANAPPWPGLLGTMEVADGAKFGMPGDDAKYYRLASGPGDDV